MSRHMILVLGLIAAVVLSLSQVAAQPASAKPASVTLVLDGTIVNFDEFRVLVVPETYLQLVPLPDDGSYSFKTDDQGRFAYDSSAPKIAVPKKAAFRFNVPNTLPGKYFLAAQRLKSQGMNAGHKPNFITNKNNKKQTLVIDVPVHAASPVTITAGDVIVWTH